LPSRAGHCEVSDVNGWIAANNERFCVFARCFAKTSQCDEDDKFDRLPSQDKEGVPEQDSEGSHVDQLAEQMLFHRRGLVAEPMDG
jgi:hypothetical protein